MLMGLSLILGSAGWAGTVFAGNVLDSRQAEALSDRLVNDDMIQTVLMARLGEGMERHVPIDQPMSRQELRSAAGTVLADPSARTILGRALAEAHTQGLAGIETDGVFSDIEVNEAARRALVAEQPSLQGRILANPLVRVRLPVQGLTWFSGLKSAVDRFAIAALALAVVGFATTFVIAEEAMAAVRRAAWWILGSAVAWLAVGPLVGVVVRFTVPSSYVVFAVAVETFLRSMADPAVVMAAFGIGMLSVSYLAPAFARRRGALLVDRARNRLGPGSVPAASAAEDALKSAAVTDRDGLARLPDGGTCRPTPSTGSVASRLSAAWLEGHGYLDDHRVAPFFSHSSRES